MALFQSAFKLWRHSVLFVTFFFSSMSALRAICLVLAQASKQEKQINLTKLAGAFQTPSASP